MQEANLRAALGEIPLSGLRFFERLGSTNDEAAAWAEAGAPDLSLVVADEQTAGRGRSGRRWFTPAGAALAFSLVLRPSAHQAKHAARIAGLGAIALVEACAGLGLKSAIKWPNDILLAGRKVGGVLVESVWNGNTLEASILGIGVNVLEGSVPPASELSYPATSIEAELGHRVERFDLLRDILRLLSGWRTRLDSDEFIWAWEAALAFRGHEVIVTDGEKVSLKGVLLGLELDGSARLGTDRGIAVVRWGEVHLRPTNDRIA